MILTFISLCLLAALLSYFYYRDTNPHISLRAKIFLGTLRFIFFLIIFLFLLTPILHFIDSSQINPEVAVVVDSSFSMNEIMQNGKTKTEIASKIVQNLQNRNKKKQLKVKNFSFRNGLSPDTTRTDILLALNQIVKQENENNLKSIILISDGLHHNNNNFHLLENITVPVYPVKPGIARSKLDLNLEKIRYNNPVYQNVKTQLQAHVTGLQQDLPVVLSLWQGKKKLMQKKFIAKKQIEDLIINYTPRNSGYQTLRFQINTSDKQEINLRNNQKQFLLNVVKNKLQITLITSQLNWDATFMHRATRKNKRYKANVLVKRDDGYYTDGNRANVADYLECDLLVLNNSNSSFEFSLPQYSKIIKFIERGGNLLYLGKIDSKLNSILPLKRSNHRGEVESSIILTKLAQNYRSFKIKDTWLDTKNFWQSLPPITSQFYSIKNNVEVLAKANLPTSNPVISFASFEKGHVLMISLSGIFRWKMWENIEKPWFDNFINSIINWLVNSQIKRRFICKTDRLQYLAGDDIEFSAHIFDEKMNLIPQKDIFLTIYRKNKSIKEKYLTENGKHYTAKIRLEKPGKYEFIAESKIGNELITHKGEFLVNKISLEQSSHGINENMLSFIAEKTGGLIAENPSQFLEKDYESKSLKRKFDFNLWKKWYIALFAIAIFSLELYIRKRKGLL